MKCKNDEITYKEIVGIFNQEDMTIEIDGEIISIQEELKEYDNCDISIKLRKEL